MWRDGAADLHPLVGTWTTEATHPAFPGVVVHSRGVFRVYNVSVDDTSWRFWRDAPGFSQRCINTFADGGDTIVGRWQLCRDDVNWHDDLEITYRRRQ